MTHFNVFVMCVTHFNVFVMCMRKFKCFCLFWCRLDHAENILNKVRKYQTFHRKIVIITFNAV